MRVPLGVIREFCNSSFSVTGSSSSSERETYGLPLLHTGAGLPLSGGFVVVDNEPKSRPLPFKGLAIYLNKVTRPDGHKGSFIALGGKTSAEECMNSLIGFYQTLIGWHSRCSYAARNGGIRDLLDAARDLLDMPVFYTSLDLRKKASSLTEEDELASEMLRIHEFRANEFPPQKVDTALIDRAAKSSKPFLYWFPAGFIPEPAKVAAYVVPLPENMGGGFVAGVSSKGRFSELQRWVMGLLADYIGLSALSSEGFYHEDAALREQLRLHLAHESGPAESRWLENRLADRFPPPMVAIAFSAKKERGRGSSPETRRTRIEAAIPNCVALPHGEAVIAIAPAGFAIDESGGASESVGRVALALNERAGLSDPFRGIDEFRACCTQALRANEIGFAVKPQADVSTFREHAFDYLLRYGTTELGPRTISGPRFEALLDHDAASAVKYLDTLEAFFACDLNVSETARRLGIGRSTLLARFERMEHVLGISLSNAGQCSSVYALIKLRRLAPGPA